MAASYQYVWSQSATEWVCYGTHLLHRTEEDYMVEQLKYLVPGNTPDPILGIASAIVFVFVFVFVKSLNGHEPDDVEIRWSLELGELEPSAENVEIVQRAVAQISNKPLDERQRGRADG
jgi:hypothetical protein